MAHLVSAAGPRRLLAVLALALAPGGGGGRGGPAPAAVELRNLGLAQLENEQPAPAAASFRKLIELAPDDPLGYADLGLSLLREGNAAEARKWIAEALRRAPGHAGLLALDGDA
ncbi:MAG TPA: tetratricopeptide repeat protein, partial [Thermoanaerobaculia bacterium]